MIILNSSAIQCVSIENVATHTYETVMNDRKNGRKKICDFIIDTGIYNKPVWVISKASDFSFGGGDCEGGGGVGY